MLERQRSEGQGLTVDAEIFSAHFPDGRIEQIPHESLPLKLRRSVKHPDGSIAFTIMHNDGSRTLGVTGGFGGKIQLQDRDKNDRYTGDGNIEPDHIEEIDLPIVGFTFTAIKFQRHGLGMRRLLTMNALSHMFFGLPLRSSSYQELPAPLSLWERLVREGKAERYPGKKLTRYRFTI